MDRRKFILSVLSAAVLVCGPAQAEVFFGYLRLAGTTTFSYNPKKNRAVIEDSLTLRQKTYRVGDVISYGAKILQIYDHGIILEKAGATKPLAISGRLGDPDEMTAGYKKISKNEWLIRPNQLLKDTAYMLELLKQVNIGGGQDGLVITQPEPGGVIRGLGIEDGDVIRAVDGEAVDSLAKVYEIYRRARKKTDISISLKRRQQEVSLDYHIVPDGPPRYNVKNVIKALSAPNTP